MFFVHARILLGFYALCVTSVTSYSTHPGIEPDVCCNYVRAEDIQAIEWIRTQTASDAVVVISSFQARNYRIGTDAGMWVEVLSGRSIRKRSYALDWDSDAALRTSCEEAAGEVYVYAGSMPYSFQWIGLERNDDFQLVFARGGARVYHIEGCQGMRP